MIRIELPAGLRRLAGTPLEISIEITGPVTQRTILDTVEDHYPMLAGTIRDHTTKLRRPYLRFFACEQDLSHLSPDDPLPEAVATGREPFLILGAIAGG
ncbi:hypothetical protein ESZ00_10300 [Silvibacterium dinghuense]|uniref:MoaD/ThiS family protein n=2 Tax=Silvibacterium dinghuense TaxID=1560006 RepID=A0A4Q1SEL0_9BACT|nr:MoaD/ThiS family protein [Silvibacterium dinghuense]RXS95712.1 hypothetical protein ESZ00_10300 [Silvibacterium dinghuense]